MPALKRVKELPRAQAVVSVIASPADLRAAGQLREPPDFFELRLDALFPGKSFSRKLPRLPAPIIITARHPAEGGENKLSARARQDLLLHFLPKACYIDVELRSARAFKPLLARAHTSGVGTIISFHDFKSTPSLGRLRAKAGVARGLGASVFKIATRTDNAAQLARLLEFVAQNNAGLPISAMGMGKLGFLSRVLLTQSGSVLAYTSLGEPRVEGQMSLAKFREIQRAIRTP